MPTLALAPEAAPAPLPDLLTREELEAKYEGLARAPVDRYKIPYIIHPFDTSTVRVRGFKGEREREDEDHGFYCHDAPELTPRFAGIGGLALRESRAQTTDRLLHAIKHHAHPGGLEAYPDGPDEQFGALVLIGGGYVSRQAWDYRDPDNPKLVTMPKRIYGEIVNSNVLHPVYHDDRNAGKKTQDLSRATIGMFFADYAKKQKLDFLDETTIDCFLHTGSSRLRRKMGEKIIGKAIEQAGSRISPIYGEAFKEQGLQPKPKLVDPSEVIKSYFYRRKWSDYFETFEEEIRYQFGLTQVAA